MKSDSGRIGAGDPRPQLCDDCRKSDVEKAKIVAKTKEDAYIAELAKLSVEERLERVERWIYNYKAPFYPYRHTGFENIG